MNKGLQIFLLGLVFLTNVAIGFGVGKIMSFTEDVIPVEEYVEEAEPVVPEIISNLSPACCFRV